ncbi:hypothetical protein BD311DRAFT_91679 [Dichomitus squalens]|uniref:Uncharacterized protein n=1 Tax=Dichomitus squalens TaxID=114155 RepID=A0A4Q9M9W2_9APHY|nr:hypothetical protein BD311DRAFT_91679 [Dichomitus squalens]
MERAEDGRSAWCQSGVKMKHRGRGYVGDEEERTVGGKAEKDGHEMVAKKAESDGQIAVKCGVGRRRTKRGCEMNVSDTVRCEDGLAGRPSGRGRSLRRNRSRRSDRRRDVGEHTIYGQGVGRESEMGDRWEISMGQGAEERLKAASRVPRRRPDIHIIPALSRPSHVPRPRGFPQQGQPGARRRQQAKRTNSGQPWKLSGVL